MQQFRPVVFVVSYSMQSTLNVPVTKDRWMLLLSFCLDDKIGLLVGQSCNCICFDTALIYEPFYFVGLERGERKNEPA